MIKRNEHRNDIEDLGSGIRVALLGSFKLGCKAIGQPDILRKSLQ